MLSYSGMIPSTSYVCTGKDVAINVTIKNRVVS